MIAILLLVALVAFIAIRWANAIERTLPGTPVVFGSDVRIPVAICQPSAYRLATKAIDLTCPTCGATSGQACSDGRHIARTKAAAAATRAANQKAKNAKETT